jgi:hypothetical protein
MSAFDILAQADLDALGYLTHPLPGGSPAPADVSADGSDPFETHLILVSARLRELRLSYHGDRMDSDAKVTALGDTLHRLALVALDRLLNLRGEPALHVLDALQWVSETPSMTIYTLKITLIVLGPLY